MGRQQAPAKKFTPPPVIATITRGKIFGNLDTSSCSAEQVERINKGIRKVHKMLGTHEDNLRSALAVLIHYKWEVVSCLANLFRIINARRRRGKERIYRSIVYPQVMELKKRFEKFFTGHRPMLLDIDDFDYEIGELVEAAAAGEQEEEEEGEGEDAIEAEPARLILEVEEAEDPIPTPRVTRSQAAAAFREARETSEKSSVALRKLKEKKRKRDEKSTPKRIPMAKRRVSFAPESGEGQLTATDTSTVGRTLPLGDCTETELAKQPALAPSSVAPEVGDLGWEGVSLKEAYDSLLAKGVDVTTEEIQTILAGAVLTTLKEQDARTWQDPSSEEREAIKARHEERIRIEGTQPSIQLERRQESPPARQTIQAEEVSLAVPSSVRGKSLANPIEGQARWFANDVADLLRAEGQNILHSTQECFYAYEKERLLIESGGCANRSINLDAEELFVLVRLYQAQKATKVTVRGEAVNLAVKPPSQPSACLSEVDAEKIAREKATRYAIDLGHAGYIITDEFQEKSFLFEKNLLLGIVTELDRPFPEEMVSPSKHQQAGKAETVPESYSSSKHASSEFPEAEGDGAEVPSLSGPSYARREDVEGIVDDFIRLDKEEAEVRLEGLRVSLQDIHVKIRLGFQLSFAPLRQDVLISQSFTPPGHLTLPEIPVVPSVEGIRASKLPAPSAPVDIVWEEPSKPYERALQKARFTCIQGCIREINHILKDAPIEAEALEALDILGNEMVGHVRPDMKVKGLQEYRARLREYIEIALEIRKGDSDKMNAAATILEQAKSEIIQLQDLCQQRRDELADRLERQSASMSKSQDLANSLKERMKEEARKAYAALVEFRHRMYDFTYVANHWERLLEEQAVLKEWNDLLYENLSKGEKFLEKLEKKMREVQGKLSEVRSSSEGLRKYLNTLAENLQNIHY